MPGRPHIPAYAHTSKQRNTRHTSTTVPSLSAHPRSGGPHYGALQDRLGAASASLLDAVEEVLHQRHRASSAIEGFNAALRPYLYVHKGATQGFLDLFRAWFNLRTRRWGRHKGTSAHECLTGQRVHDWLTLLGCPPSPTLH